MPPTRQTGPLRGDRVRVAEDAQDLQLAADALLVEALQAAARHRRRHAVTELARDAEAQRERLAVARRIHGRDQQRPALEMVARPQHELGEHVRPVGGKRRERGVPLVGERCGRRRGSRLLLRHAGELERACEALPVEPEQRAPQRFGPEAVAAGDEQAQRVAAPERVRASEQRRGAVGVPFADLQDDAQVRPVPR